MHEDLLIIGASGHGKVVADIALHMEAYKNIAFLDDDTSVRECMGFPVIGKSSDFLQHIRNADFFVAIGNPQVRKRVMEELFCAGAEVPVLIHPNATIGNGVVIGSGSVVMAGAVINSDSEIGQGCIVNTCASVDHDCSISAYTHVAVGAHVAGTVTVGEGCWIGAGAVVKNNVEICSNCTIGAGAVVIENIDISGTYIGVPARRKDMNKCLGGGVKPSG